MVFNATFNNISVIS